MLPGVAAAAPPRVSATKFTFQISFEENRPAGEQHGSFTTCSSCPLWWLPLSARGLFRSNLWHDCDGGLATAVSPSVMNLWAVCDVRCRHW